MNAADIAKALDPRARRIGRVWRCRCPLHGHRSLQLCDGANGILLVKCWGGCDPLEVLAELRRLGLYQSHRQHFEHQPDDNNGDKRRDRALTIWRNTRRGQGSPVEVYLTSRSIRLDPWPASLRFHPLCPHPSGTPTPAMVALVKHVDHGPVAIHRTFLKPDGSGKADADPDKASLGPIKGGAVWFGMPQAGERFVIGEGIESILSVIVACQISGCAALSAGGVENLILPAEATNVIIAGDKDANGVGQRAAHSAGQRFLRERRSVKLALPPILDVDFNSLLIGELNG